MRSVNTLHSHMVSTQNIPCFGIIELVNYVVENPITPVDYPFGDVASQQIDSLSNECRKLFRSIEKHLSTLDTPEIVLYTHEQGEFDLNEAPSALSCPMDIISS